MNSDANDTKAQSGLPAEGFCRVDDFVGRGKALPFSRSTWYGMQKAGTAPKPILLTSRVAAYPVSEIRSLLASLKASTTTVLSPKMGTGTSRNNGDKEDAS
jgi:predicted DNA-binding transcriptional regulator AlpA